MMAGLSNTIITALLFALLLPLPRQAVAQQSEGLRYSPPIKLDDGIRTGTHRAAKLDEAKLTHGMSEIKNGAYGNIHSVLILRKGRLVWEAYFTGEDENNHQGKIGVVTHTRDTLHDTRSISKSVVALAVLVAHAQGKIKDLDQSVFHFLPEYQRLADGDKQAISLRHVLSMTAGLDWNENVSYRDPANTAKQMNSAPDPVEFVLSRKLIHKPGIVFEYNGGLTQVLAAVVKKATGSDVAEFTSRHFLSPLGITKYEWAKLNDHGPDTDSGLRLRSRDLAKLGLLVVNEGRWQGKQVIPAKLLNEAMSPRIMVSKEPDGWTTNYGYQTWLQNFPYAGKRRSVIEFSGNGGQKVLVDKENDLVVVITAGNYDRQLKKHSFDILLDIVYPAMKGSN